MGLRPGAGLINDESYQIFTCPALSGNENAARLRSDSLDHVENGAHLRALSDDIVEPGEPSDLPAEIAGFLLPFQALGHFINSAAQLVHELVVFYDVPVGAGVDRRDRGLHGGDAGDKQKEGLRRDLFDKLEEIHAATPGHAN